MRNYFEIHLSHYLTINLLIMKKIKLLLAFVGVGLSVPSFALENDNVQITGTYQGSLEHRQVHVEAGEQIEDVNDTNYEVSLILNHDQFVLKDDDFAFAGTFEAIDGQIYLNVTDVKGNPSYDLRNRKITYKLKRGNLQLYSTDALEDGASGQDIVILNLNKI